MRYEQNGIIYDATVAEVAAVFNKHPSTIRLMAKKYGLPHIRLGKNYVFSMAQCRQFIVRTDTQGKQVIISPDAYDV